jgi:hypothetical protein
MTLADMIQWLLEFVGLKSDYSHDENIFVKYGAGQTLSDIGREFGI